MQESGFIHSAFTFAHETMLGRTGLRSADKVLPPGALITFLQKGLQYVGIEEALQQEEAKPSSRRVSENEADFSLLAPPTIAALARNKPPIQLNVPPATAAAAIKARLEAEAKLQAQQNAAMVSNHLSANGPLASPVLPIQQQVMMEDANALLARQALAAQAAAAHAAAAMSQLHHHMGQTMMTDTFSQQQRAAAAADIMALQRHGSFAAVPTNDNIDAAAALASVAAQGVKRVVSGVKRGRKKKNKTGEQVNTEVSEYKRPAEDDRVAEVDSQQAEAMDVDDNDDNGYGPARPAHVDDQRLFLNGENVHPGPLGKSSKHLNGGADRAFNEAPDPDDADTAVPENEVLQLQMHESEVFMCAWNPVHTRLIASGSGDASARIWEMNGMNAEAGVRNVILLAHGSDTTDRKNKDVTTLEWSSDGELLATGSYDGIARVWSRHGALMFTLRKHTGPIFSLKWNKGGNYVLSGSYDKTAIVWDVSEAKDDPVVQQFVHHNDPVLDVDWRDNDMFASCSTDRTVHIYRVGQSNPVKIYEGHDDEVNAVKWDPSGTYLASCSDDCSAKVWEFGSDRPGPLHDFTSHKQEIYTVKWSPLKPGPGDVSERLLLATASFDGTVRLWNIKDGSCYRVFSRHRDSVYTVSFSPSGTYLASGSLAGQMYIWNIEESRHVKSYKGKGDIFEVAWNKEETLVAACFSSSVVTVIDFDRAAVERKEQSNS